MAIYLWFQIASLTFLAYLLLTKKAVIMVAKCERNVSLERIWQGVVLFCFVEADRSYRPAKLIGVFPSSHLVYRSWIEAQFYWYSTRLAYYYFCSQQFLCKYGYSFYHFSKNKYEPKSFKENTLIAYLIYRIINFWYHWRSKFAFGIIPEMPSYHSSTKFE